MSVDLISAVLGASAAVIKALVDSKLITIKGATVYHKYSEIEYRFDIKIVSEHSRSDGIIRTIQSYMQKPVEFNEVVEILGYGLPHNENLEEFGIIRVDGAKAIVDFALMLQAVKSDLVVLMIRTKFPEELKRKLVALHIGQNATHHDSDYVETTIDISLDYADLWYKTFDSFIVRDIEFSFNLNIALKTIEELIPSDFKKRIRSAAKAIATGNQKAAEFLKIMNDNFLTFEREDRVSELIQTVSVEPKRNFDLKSIIPTMQSCEISGVGHPIILPGSMKILLACRLEGRQIALNGTARIDLRKFKNILGHIISDIQKQSLNF